jgi:hypothetical protein
LGVALEALMTRSVSFSLRRPLMPCRVDTVASRVLIWEAWRADVVCVYEWE